MTKVIAAVITVFGLGKLMVVHRVKKFITLYGRREFVKVLKKNLSLCPILIWFDPDTTPPPSILFV